MRATETRTIVMEVVEAVEFNLLLLNSNGHFALSPSKAESSVSVSACGREL